MGDDQDELEVVPDGEIRTRCAEFSHQPITALEITDVHPCEPVVLGLGALESTETDEDDIVTSIYKLDWNTLPFHNGEHELELKVNFTPDIGEPETIELKQNVDILNLVVESVDPEGVIVWKGEGGTVPITVNIQDNDLSDPMDITLTIRDTIMRDVIAVLEKTGVTGGSHTFNWDGNENSVTPWTYTYEVSVSQVDTNDEGITVNDHATYRSTYLQILRAADDEGNPIFEAEFHEYDDKGTPEEDDDDYIYIVRHYALRDGGGLDASEGEIWLFNPDLNKVKTWDISSLECLIHEENDGLEADEQGIAHAVLVPVPVAMMNDEGEYIFVVHAKDDHAPEYRDHEKRWALELNSTVIRRLLWVEHDWMTHNGVELKSKAHDEAFRRAYEECGWIVIFCYQCCTEIPYDDMLTEEECQTEYEVYWGCKHKEHGYSKVAHVIGAAYCTRPLAWGYGPGPQAFVFVQRLIDHFPADHEKMNRLVTIHEVGHAKFGLVDCDNTTRTVRDDDPTKRKYCIMHADTSAQPWMAVDSRFCDRCKKKVKPNR